MSEPFFKTDCPSCGAPVHAHSATAVTLVCGFCHSLLVRQGEGIIDSGRDSALLEDFSPLQIGTSGTFANRPFAIIGRLQAKYDAGMWNEWYVQFEDGGNGWLSESGDQYVFTLPAAEPLQEIHEFSSLVAGRSSLIYRNKRFWAADVRDIVLEQAAAQGELPFAVPPQMKNQVADWRCEQIFLTLDYASSPPEVFVGQGVKLADLQLGNTRSSEQVADSAGRLKGTRQAESCPNCGSPVQWITGLTPSILCPSCGSNLDATEGKLELLQANNRRNAQAYSFTLNLGAEATIKNRTYTLIGAVRREELEPEAAFQAVYHGGNGGVVGDPWTEYLLFEPQAGFMWLVESGDGEWSVSETLNVWPRLQGDLFQPQGLRKLYDYGGRVVFAAGAFYWHIRQGDVDFYSDYRQNSNGKLCAECNRHEASWSQSTPVSYRQVRRWFGIGDGKIPQHSADRDADLPPTWLVALLSIIFIIINLPAWAAMFLSPEDMSLPGVASFLVFYFLIRRGRLSDDEE